MGNLKTLLKKSKINSKKTAKTSGNHKGRSPNTEERDMLEALFAEGQYAEVITRAQEMTVRFPHDGFGWKVLGVVLNHIGRVDDALAAMKKAAMLAPNDPETLSNLGAIWQALGHLDDAVKCCRQAIKINPNYASPHSNLGNALHDLGQFENAVNSYRRALAIKPDFAQAHNNMGIALQKLGQFNNAVCCHRQALAIEPDYAEAHNNLSSALQHLGQLDDAIASRYRALAIKPDYAEAHSNLLFLLSHSENVEASDLFAEYCRFAEQHEAPLLDNWPKHTNSRFPDRCLQIGFVSADMRNHAVANYIEPIFRHLARSPLLSLHAYHNHALEDNVTQQLRSYIAHWHRIVSLSDAALAERIQADGIDILIDLSNHTAGNRLLTFARKPAPLQATWIGYPGTTGLKAMDYYFPDRFLLPPGQFEEQFTEKFVYLPGSASFLPYNGAPPVNTLPALSNGHLTFGSFNRPNKLSSSIIALWSKILLALPNARMILGAMPQSGENKLLIEWFAKEGVSSERLTFYPKESMDAYLALHHQIDICLDTFPANGATTTCHALWMGVPTLTLAGKTAPSRIGAEALGHVGLELFIAHNKTEFIEKGVLWGSNLAELAQIRQGLRNCFEKTALCQPGVIASAFERALRIMWQRWCAGLPAQSFEITMHDIDNVS